jgi:hypothetical protein
MGVIGLGDGLHPLHEAREVLELRPLVVRGADRDLDVDALDHGSHGALLVQSGLMFSVVLLQGMRQS